jgi:signal transduction histidine kinase
MKSKIRFRLLCYFAGSFLLLVLVTGILFLILFSLYNTEVHKADLENRAARISETLSGFYDNGFSGVEHGMGQGQGQGQGQGSGYGAYMRFLDDIAMSEVWVVDRNLEQVARGHGQSTLSYQDLPPGAEEIILQAMAGSTTVSEGFGEFMGVPTVTAATPIVSKSGEVIGAVLLHEQTDVVSGTTERALLILLASILVAVVIASIVARLLAGCFVLPLRKMKAATGKVSAGDFSARTGVRQDDEIGELAAAFDDMSARLDAASKESEKLDRLRRDFMSNISHELRTPVAVIRGSLEAICEHVVTDSEKIAEYHKQMLAESVFLERLVSDLLDLARLQNPDLQIEISMLDMKELVGDAIRSAARIAEKKGITIQLEVNGSDFSFKGDYGRLRQMLMIVLDNAVKFSAENGVVSVALTQAPDLFRLSVTDHGCGIASKDLEHVFERFFRQRSEENKCGTGLGLSIARHIAERHGLEITLTSKLGSGTKVVFCGRSAKNHEKHRATDDKCLEM